MINIKCRLMTVLALVGATNLSAQQPPEPAAAADPRRASLEALLARDPSNLSFRDEKGRIDAVIGDLSDPTEGDPELAAREFLREHGHVIGMSLEAPPVGGQSGPAPTEAASDPSPPGADAAAPTLGFSTVSSQPTEAESWPLICVDHHVRDPITVVRFQNQIDGLAFKDGEIQVQTRAVDENFLFEPQPDLPDWAREQEVQLFNPDFLEVNAFYHITNTNTRLNQSYQAHDVFDFKIDVDVMAPYNPADSGSVNNAYCSPSR